MRSGREIQRWNLIIMTAVLSVCIFLGIRYGTGAAVETFTSEVTDLQEQTGEWTQILLDDLENTSAGTAVIRSGGAYRISGTLDEGQICVDVADEEEVLLCLAGVQIKNSSEAAVYIKNAKKTTILLEAGTENILQSGEKPAADVENDEVLEQEEAESVERAEEGDAERDGISEREEAESAERAEEGDAERDGISEREEAESGERVEKGDAESEEAENGERAEGENAESSRTLELEDTGDEGEADAEETEIGTPAKAVVYARDDLEITGEGTLEVYGYLHNGIHTTNHLSVDSGTIRVEAVNVGIKGKDSVTITGGDFTIISGGDGIKSNDTTGGDYGQIRISGGTFQIESGKDGIQAETMMNISGGDFTLISGGGSEAAPDVADRGEEGFFGHPGGQGGRAPRPSSDQEGKMDQSFVRDVERTEAPFLNDEEEMLPSSEQHGEMVPPSQDRQQDEVSSEQGMGDGVPPEMPDSGRQEFSVPPDHMEGEAGAGRMERGGHREDMSGDRPGIPGVGMEEAQAEEEEDTPSCKGLKSGVSMEISGGTFTVDACDDAFHSDGTILVSDGMLFIKTGDDGIHADTALTVTGGTIEIESCYEGLEANQIQIEDGEIRITSSDDGMNASGGSSGWSGRGMGDMENMEETEEEMPNLCISGGTVLVNAGGDGLDSNGNLTILGGTVIVDGPSDNGNGALDSGSESGGHCMVHGGLVLAIGSSGMAESFDSSSEQGFFSCRLASGFQAGSVITVKDMAGQTLYTHTAAKEGTSIVFSCPELVEGESYIVDVDGETQEIGILVSDI